MERAVVKCDECGKFRRGGETLLVGGKVVCDACRSGETERKKRESEARRQAEREARRQAERLLKEEARREREAREEELRRKHYTPAQQEELRRRGELARR